VFLVLERDNIEEPGNVCQMCGVRKDADSFYDRPHGLSPYCIECEEKFYDRQAETNGSHIALYNTCGAFNVPFFPEMLPDVKDFLAIEDRWIFYNELIDERIHTNRGVLGYFDGETDILRLFGEKLSQSDTAKFVQFSREAEANLPGTAEQRERWGTRDLYAGLEVSDEVYKSLDRRLEKKLERYRNYTDAQQYENILKLCKYDETEDFLLSMGFTQDAQRIQKMREELMASEEMRRKDEKAQEAMRVDALVVAMETQGLMKDGKFLKFDELIDVFDKRFFKAKKGHSTDAVDQMIADYYNTTRKNAGLESALILPSELQVDDVNDEFDEEMSAEEKEAYRYASKQGGATPVVYGDDLYADPAE
jgi:hypothetical protein